MQEITLKLTDYEMEVILKVLEQLRTQPQYIRRSRWIRKDGYMIDPLTGRKLDTATNRFVEF